MTSRLRVQLAVLLIVVITYVGLHVKDFQGPSLPAVQVKGNIHGALATCCLHPSMDVKTRLTPQFFENQRTTVKDRRTNWTGNEYDEWVVISARLNPNHIETTNLDCTTQYSLLLLEKNYGFLLRTVLTDLGNGRLDFFPYYEERSGLPRILLIGDSVSIGIRRQTQLLYHEQANILGAPTNAGGFPRYETELESWLGDCPWDLVQFNVGMHFHATNPYNSTSWYDEYRQGITNIVHKIRAHSPKAQIVFALTTPSPMDSLATIPDGATCRHLEKFHKAGFVPAMNGVMSSLSEEFGIIINDRYSAIYPVLGEYQCSCDIHYSETGYQILANQDWKVFSTVLRIANKTFHPKETGVPLRC